jgi:NADPH-dependent 2,4-dienoyl-CoA reductase/sulfur reductase-like enzyme
VIHEYQTLVVGSGPAGIAAAVCAAESGVRVGLIDDNPHSGGQIWRTATTSKNSAGGEQARWRSRLHAAPIENLQGWSVFDAPSRGILRAERSGKAADFHYQNLILATGARERFLPFPGWTLPNVMGVGAMQAMVKEGLPICGKRVVIAGSGPLLLAVAASLSAAGAIVVCICEQAPLARLVRFALCLSTMPRKIAEGLRYKSALLNVPYHPSSWPIEAGGDARVRWVALSIRGKVQRLECDYLACGFHLVPNIEPAAMLGCQLEDRAVTIDPWQQTSQPNIYCAGEPTGIGGLELALIEGQIAGLAAAGRKEQARQLFKEREKLRRFASRLADAFTLRPELKSLPQPSTLLCRCEDVPYSAVCSHPSWRSAKLHTRCGMGPCQGRVCGAATEFLFGWNADSTRPPVFPALISSLAASQMDHPVELETIPTI